MADSPVPIDPQDTMSDGIRNLQLASNPAILRLPVENRLDILRNSVAIDQYKFCPHVRLPLLVSSPRAEQRFIHKGEPVPCLFGSKVCGWRQGQRGSLNKMHDECLEAYLKSQIRPAGVNKFDLSVLSVCQQIYAEAVDIFYSENIFYFEQYLTPALDKSQKKPVSWPLPNHLTDIPPKYLKLIKKIGFAVVDESVLDHKFVMLQRLCAWINENLPNLQHTYIFLFSPNVPAGLHAYPPPKKSCNRPSDRFLIKTIRFLDSIPGNKTIEFRGSNNSKRIVGNILAPHFRGRSKDYRTINVIGGCYCQCWVHKDSNLHEWTGPDTLWPWLRDWNDRKASNALKGSVTPQLCHKHKGLLTGCLMCHKWKECIHDHQNALLKPGRIEPNGHPEAASYSSRYGLK
ncbi:MAG: hypothetical protein Q9213_003180 [Squamulea squamosa]